MAVKILVLAGSGEFTSKMIPVDTFLLSQTKGKNKTVAILPTAAGAEKDPHRWIADGVGHFTKLGIRAFGVPILNRDDAAKDQFLEQVRKASMIYFSGGDPGYLYKSLSDTPIWKFILPLYQQGVILADSSAGAMVMGNYVLSNAQRLASGEKPFWKKSFGLVKFAILPHYDYVVREMSDVFNDALKSGSENGLQLLGIDEDTAMVIFNNKKAKIMGQGSVHILKNSKNPVLNHGESFNLSRFE